MTCMSWGRMRMPPSTACSASGLWGGTRRSRSFSAVRARSLPSLVRGAPGWRGDGEEAEPKGSLLAMMISRVRDE